MRTARRLILAIVIGVAVLAAGGGPGARAAQQAERIALVIGNAEYQHALNLRNPRNDAADIGEALERAGFSVTRLIDATRRDLLVGLKEFRRAAVGAEMAVLYFAGHGMEIDRSNFVIPVDAQLKADLDVEYEAVALDDVILAVEGARQLSLVILDACRDNPFITRMMSRKASRSVGRGLGDIEPRGNTLVAYAARAGTTAADGEGRNSPYARALLKVLEEPGIEIGKLFRRVRDDVLERTAGQQEPFVYGSISARDIFLHPPRPGAAPVPRPGATTAGGATGPASGPATAAAGIELAFWNTIAASRDHRDFEDYLALYPDGVFAPLARRRVERYRSGGTEEALQMAAVDPAQASGPAPETRAAAPSVDLAAPDRIVATVDRPRPPRLAALGPGPLTSVPGDRNPPLAITLSVARPPWGMPGVPTRPQRPVRPAPAPDHDRAPGDDPRTWVVETPPADPAAVERALGLSRQDRRRVQAILTERGFDPRGVDGLFGPNTRAALRRWQRSVGVAETGYLDASTWRDEYWPQAVAAAHFREQEAARAAARRREAERRAAREREARQRAAREPARQAEPAPARPAPRVAEPAPAARPPARAAARAPERTASGPTPDPAARSTPAARLAPSPPEPEDDFTPFGASGRGGGGGGGGGGGAK